MQPAPIPQDELARIAALRSLNVLDTEPEERFDQLTRIARRLFSVPIALVTLVDSHRQWFKSCSEHLAFETPREHSFCAHALLGSEILQVENALEDERFHDNPLVLGKPNIRFYAGCPLQIDGFSLGTLCLIDSRPRSLSAEEQTLLRDLARMAEQNLATEQMAVTDSLTRLTNRRGFDLLLHQALTVARRTGHTASLLFFDLVRFKEINDTYGHAEGDHALRTFADCLLSVFRESDAVCRLGGDEFAVLLSSAAPQSAAQAVERLRAAVEERNREESHGYQIGFSAGEVVFDPLRHTSAQALLEEADAAMYRDKAATR